MKTAFEIQKKAETSRSNYWGVGPTVTVLETPRFDDRRRFLCMTDLLNDCKHVQAVKCFLSNDSVEAGQ